MGRRSDAKIWGVCVEVDAVIWIDRDFCVPSLQEEGAFTEVDCSGPRDRFVMEQFGVRSEDGPVPRNVCLQAIVNVIVVHCQLFAKTAHLLKNLFSGHETGACYGQAGPGSHGTVKVTR